MVTWGKGTRNFLEAGNIYILIWEVTQECACVKIPGAKCTLRNRAFYMWVHSGHTGTHKILIIILHSSSELAPFSDE